MEEILKSLNEVKVQFADIQLQIKNLNCESEALSEVSMELAHVRNKLDGINFLVRAEIRNSKS